MWMLMFTNHTFANQLLSDRVPLFEQSYCHLPRLTEISMEARCSKPAFGPLPFPFSVSISLYAFCISVSIYMSVYSELCAFLLEESLPPTKGDLRQSDM